MALNLNSISLKFKKDKNKGNFIQDIVNGLILNIEKVLQDAKRGKVFIKLLKSLP